MVLTIRSDTIRPPGVYVRMNNDNDEWTTEYYDTINGMVHINRDKNGDVCSVMVIDYSRCKDE